MSYSQRSYDLSIGLNASPESLKLCGISSLTILTSEEIP